MSNLIFIILSLGIVPLNDIPVSEVDEVRLNHVYDEHGKRYFSQLIFYDYDIDGNRVYVGWCKVSLDKELTPKQKENRLLVDGAIANNKDIKQSWIEDQNPDTKAVPQYKGIKHKYILLEKDNVLYRLNFKYFGVSHTSYDEELEDRQPKEFNKVILWINK